MKLRREIELALESFTIGKIKSVEIQALLDKVQSYDDDLVKYYNLFNQYKLKSDRLEEKQAPIVQEANKNRLAFGSIARLGLLQRIKFVFSPKVIVDGIKKDLKIEVKK